MATDAVGHEFAYRNAHQNGRSPSDSRQNRRGAANWNFGPCPTPRPALLASEACWTLFNEGSPTLLCVVTEPDLSLRFDLTAELISVA